ncbi:hypothetical protein [Streptomyces sp. TP-A0874]|uniref:hypothetical protein n=1 Tax=Streptomyces sp. TP-A0874 TaxID=549819 RepID=UPI00085316BF|nr:hypothetical protein [Streptomyces sp. TP-A0874]
MTRRLPQVTAFWSATVLLTLTGCMTVHGEREVIPATSEAEAARVLKKFNDGYNEANRELDSGVSSRYSTGALDTISQADIKAARAEHPDGRPNYSDLKLSDARYVIPKQAGWPKFFVADTKSNRDGNRWLFVFVRNGADAPWKASYLSILSQEKVPEFATDKDGWAEPVANDSAAGLRIAPGKLSKAYTDFLQTGEGDLFEEGRATTGQREDRDKYRKTPKYWTQYADQPANPPRYAPVALRTEDGGALVFFAAHHTQKQTMAEGYRIGKINDRKAEALLTGEANKSLTVARISESAVKVPLKGDGGGILFLNRLEGLTAVKGG